MSINYAAFAPTKSPLQMATEGFQQGQQMQADMLANQKNQLALQQYMKGLERKQAMQQGLIGLRGVRDPQKFQDFLLQFPEMSEAMQESLKMMSDEQKAYIGNRSMMFANLIYDGKVEIAKQEMQKDIDAAKASGDQTRAAGLQAQLDVLNADPESAATMADTLAFEALGVQGYTQFLSQKNASKDPAKLQEAAAYAEAKGFKKGTKEYNKAVVEYLTPKPLVSIGGQEGAFAQEAGKGRAKRYIAFESAGDAARSNVATLDVLESLLGRVETGGGAQIKLLAGRFGIPSEGLSDLQAAEALLSKLVPAQRPQGSGTTSDADLAMFKASLPQIINQPNGNKLIVDTLRNIYDYDIKRSNIASQVLSGQLDAVDAERQLNELGDPMAAWRQQYFGSSQYANLGKFANMSKDDLISVDINQLSDEELLQYRDALKKAKQK